MSSEPMQSMTVRPSVQVGGRISVPGDKSISHRVAMLAGMSEGRSEIRGFLRGEDCEYTLDAMAAVGAKVYREADVICVDFLVCPEGFKTPIPSGKAPPTRSVPGGRNSGGL